MQAYKKVRFVHEPCDMILRKPVVEERTKQVARTASNRKKTAHQTPFLAVSYDAFNASPLPAKPDILLRSQTSVACRFLPHADWVQFGRCASGEVANERGALNRPEPVWRF